MSSVVFSDEFRVEQVNPEGKKFEKGALPGRRRARNRWRTPPRRARHDGRAPRRARALPRARRRPRRPRAVDRLLCKGVVYELEFLVGARAAPGAREAPRAATRDPPRADINCEIFDVDDGNKLSVAIATSLSLDGTDTTDFLQLDGRPSLLDQYDYVMHGVVYKFKSVGGTKVEVLLSHGGLLARFIGDQRHLQKLKVDTEVYTLIRKV